MRGKAHLACGIIAGAGVSITGVLSGNLTVLDSVLLTVSSSFVCLLPDIDHPDSTLGHRIKPVAKFIKNNIGHRTTTHSGLWLILFGFLIFVCFGSWLFPVVLGAAVGFLSHLLSDTLTVGGVPWLWPLSRKRYRLTPIKSGHLDWLLTILTDIIIIGAAYGVFNYLMPKL